MVAILLNAVVPDIFKAELASRCRNLITRGAVQLITSRAKIDTSVTRRSTTQIAFDKAHSSKEQKRLSQRQHLSRYFLHYISMQPWQVSKSAHAFCCTKTSITALAMRGTIEAKHHSARTAIGNVAMTDDFFTLTAFHCTAIALGLIAVVRLAMA